MIESIKRGLSITEIEDIFTFNLMIMKGIYKIPRTTQDKLNQLKFRKQLKIMANG